jgi:hypothetical protein
VQGTIDVSRLSCWSADDGEKRTDTVVSWRRSIRSFLTLAMSICAAGGPSLSQRAIATGPSNAFELEAALIVAAFLVFLPGVGGAGEAYLLAWLELASGRWADPCWPLGPRLNCGDGVA